MEIFSITPYITFKHIKEKNNILADSPTQKQRLVLYEKCPCEEDNQDCEITTFDERESIKVAEDPDSFSPADLNMILSVINEASANVNHNFDKDTFVLDEVTDIIDDRHPTKPQIYLTPQHIKRMQLHDQSLATTIPKLRKIRYALQHYQIPTFSMMMVYYTKV